VTEELLVYISVQLELPTTLIVAYQQKRQTVSEHQHCIMDYLHVRASVSVVVDTIIRFL